MLNGQPVLDAAAHPIGATGEEIRAYMTQPWKSRAFPGPERYQYASTLGEYADGTQPADGLPGSDPDMLALQLAESGIDRIVLLPLTRGLLANIDLATVVAAATNSWLAERWLEDLSHHGRFLGTIRVNPRDPVSAAAEIERWADHPLMVQIAVPTQAHHPYGQRHYSPIWEAAATHGLPVAIHADGGASIDFPPTAAGYVRQPLEYRALHPLNVAYHLASFVAEGVFDRLPDLRIVCADGGFAAFTTLLWRLDKDWRSTREEIPWSKRLPSTSIAAHVRFCLHDADLPRAEVEPDEWFEVLDPDGLCMYSSNYPQSDYVRPDRATHGLPEDVAARLLWTTAAELYAIEQPNPERGTP